ncbi:MAG: hypothetical protein NTU58_02415 [Candidatus Nealsonbacteria bacterium]|nr:hypothetical protein [Candidatus Nealsonbacteria bacterium]
MKDIVLGEIKENTIVTLRLARGKIKGKRIQIGLLHDSNAEKNQPFYFVNVQRLLWWRFAILGTAKSFNYQDKEKEKEDANKYFSSLMEKYNLTEVH